mmetsp:Transcript_78982/g.223532  ORF Transcript_78982/g.223532 Transcript_78982/m.223532 type:complete len:648 (-) Transcript_78982:157-2100(-)
MAWAPSPGRGHRAQRWSTEATPPDARAWSRWSLLHGDTLGEVPGLIDAAAAHLRNVVRQELQRYGRHDRLELQLRDWASDDKACDLVEVVVALVCQDQDGRMVGPQLLDVLLDLLVGRVRLHRDADRGQVGLDEREGCVLDLGGGEPLGMDVGYLLEFQRPLERGGEVDAAPAEDGVRRQPEVLGDRLDLRHERLVRRACAVGVEPAIELVRYLVQGVAVAVQLGLRDRLPLHRDLQRHDAEGHDLPCEGLGRGDADLGAGVQVDAGVREARDARAHDVYHAERERLVLLGDFDRLQGVGRLPALRYRYHDVVGGDQRAAVAELAGVLYLHGQLCEALDDVLAYHPRVKGRTASADDDPLRIAQAVQSGPVAKVFHGLLQAAKLDLPRLRLLRVVVEPPAHDVAERVGLVHDFLQHEVLVAALLDLVQRHLQVDDGVVPGLRLVLQVRVVLDRRDLVGLPADLDEVALPEVHDILGVLDDGGRVAPQHVLVLPHAEQQRGALPGADEQVRVVLEDEDDPVGPLHHLQGPRDDPALLQLRHLVPHALHQVRQALGVRLALEDVALLLQLLLERLVVLDHAVVHDGYGAVVGDVRVRVLVRRLPVRRPARVGDADGTLKIRRRTCRFQVYHLPDLLLDFDWRPMDSNPC